MLKALSSYFQSCLALIVPFSLLPNTNFSSCVVTDSYSCHRHSWTWLSLLLQYSEISLESPYLELFFMYASPPYMSEICHFAAAMCISFLMFTPFQSLQAAFFHSWNWPAQLLLLLWHHFLLLLFCISALCTYSTWLSSMQPWYHRALPIDLCALHLLYQLAMAILWVVTSHQLHKCSPLYQALLCFDILVPSYVAWVVIVINIRTKVWAIPWALYGVPCFASSFIEVFYSQFPWPSWAPKWAPLSMHHLYTTSSRVLSFVDFPQEIQGAPYVIALIASTPTMLTSHKHLHKPCPIATCSNMSWKSAHHHLLR